MSDPTQPPTPPASTETPYKYVPPPPDPRGGCATAIMVVFGVILLLPGLCALIFAAGSIQSSNFDTGLLPYLVIGLLVAFVGIVLIRTATKNQ